MQTIRPLMPGLFYIGTTIAFTVIGQVLVKSGMLQVGKSPTGLALLPHYFVTTLTNPCVILGLGCAVIAALSWTVAVSRTDLSFAYPFMGLAIVLVLALSGAVFGENVILGRWIGVVIVCVGLVVAATAR